MKNLIVEQKLSALIERKINSRNEKAKDTPRNDALVKFLDEEINVLEDLEQYICDLSQYGAAQIINASRESFRKGVQSGLLEAKTGRAHPMHLID